MHDDEDVSPSESVAEISDCFLLSLRNVASKLSSRESSSPLTVLLVFIHLKQQQTKLEKPKQKIKTKNKNKKNKILIPDNGAKN